MSVLDRFEKRIEKVVNSAFSKAFGDSLKPVDIAQALRQHLDDKAVSLSQERTVIPNEFQIHLAESDNQRVGEWGESALEDEFCRAIEDYAAEQGYSFVGPVAVEITADGEMPTGKIRVTSITKRGNVAPASAASPSAQNPILEIGENRYLLTGPVTVLGRGKDADIVVEDSGVSRRHLEIRVTPQGVIATDLGSTNGSFVEGNRITAATLIDGNEIMIGRTRIRFWSTPAGGAGQ